jgi:hypothetical protein
MSLMFSGATSAQPNISNWTLTALSNTWPNSSMTTFVDNAQSLNSAHYSAMLIKAKTDVTANGGLPTSVRIDMGATHYSADAAAARSYLVGIGWTITDGGPE